MHRAVVLVGPGGVGEQPLDRRLDLPGRRLGALTGRSVQPPPELVGACAQVLGDIVENLGAIVRRLRGPAGARTRRLDGVADILAVAVANFADQVATRVVDRPAVARIGPGLLAADVVLGRTVQRRSYEF